MKFQRDHMWISDQVQILGSIGNNAWKSMKFFFTINMEIATIAQEISKHLDYF